MQIYTEYLIKKTDQGKKQTIQNRSKVEEHETLFGVKTKLKWLSRKSSLPDACIHWNTLGA